MATFLVHGGTHIIGAVAEVETIVSVHSEAFAEGVGIDRLPPI